ELSTVALGEPPAGALSRMRPSHDPPGCPHAIAGPIRPTGGPMHLLPLWSLLLVSAYPAEAHAQDAQPDWTDTVRLTFDWPQDLQARVDLQRFRVQLTPEGADSTGVALSYEMDVSE